MPMNWTADVDREMLLHIITSNNVKRDNEAIAAHLNGKFGTNCTAKAVKEHFDGMKKKHEAALAAGGSATPSGSVPATPTKKTPAKKASAAADGEGGSPAKKRKRTTKPKKDESDEDSGNGGESIKNEGE